MLKLVKSLANWKNRTREKGAILQAIACVSVKCSFPKWSQPRRQ